MIIWDVPVSVVEAVGAMFTILVEASPYHTHLHCITPSTSTGLSWSYDNYLNL